VAEPQRSDPADPADSAGPVDPAEWPEGLISARTAFDQGLPGWPRKGQKTPGPTAPVPDGRGGEQRIPRPFNAKPGGPPPWADLPPERRRPTIADVRKALDGLGPPVPSPREAAGVPARPSAVLAPVYEQDGQAMVVLTRRTWALRTHQGEMSFPGGRIEPGEAAVDGALREAEEEVALDPSTVEIVGELDHLSTVSSMSFIVPFVGLLPGRPDITPNPDEVEAVVHAPLAELADPAVFREELWTFPGGYERSIYFFELVGDTVWGMTAALLRQLVGIVTGTLGRGDLDHP
jgi:8-oxo-dGTP pyrophosphatase MutT (NUDIX family)